MNNLFIARGSADTPTAWTAISPDTLVVSGTLTALASNTGTIAVRSAETVGSTATLEAGASFPLVKVDLATIQLQASASGQGFSFIGDNDRRLM